MNVVERSNTDIINMLLVGHNILEIDSTISANEVEKLIDFISDNTVALQCLTVDYVLDISNEDVYACLRAAVEMCLFDCVQAILDHSSWLKMNGDNSEVVLSYLRLTMSNFVELLEHSFSVKLLLITIKLLRHTLQRSVGKGVCMLYFSHNCLAAFVFVTVSGTCTAFVSVRVLIDNK